MTSKITSELESCLQSLDTTAAAELESTVRNAIAAATQTPTPGESQTIGELWTPEFMAEIRELWGDAPFERRSQPSL